MYYKGEDEVLLFQFNYLFSYNFFHSVYYSMWWDDDDNNDDDIKKESICYCLWR